MHMDHKFSEIDHVTPLFNLFLVVHLPTHSAELSDFSSRRAEFGRLAVLGWSENLPEPLDGVTV